MGSPSPSCANSVRPKAGSGGVSPPGSFRGCKAGRRCALSVVKIFFHLGLAGLCFTRRQVNEAEDAQAFASRQFQKWKRGRNLLLEHGRHEKRANSHRHPPEPMPSAAGGGPACWREFPAFQRRPSTAGCVTGQGPAPAVPGLFPRLRKWSVDFPTGP